MATAGVNDGAALEADTIDNLENYDSGFESDVESNRSASITSSITGYKYENGRRYHAYREGAYYLPNDEAEQARMDLVHHIYRLALDGALYLAPIPQNIERCLDIGTGTGIWAIDFADEFPNCEVIGTDLSPIQPTWIPSNLRFVVDDVEAEWSYGAHEAFDFIHARMMGGALSDLARLFKQIFDNLKPGAWCEMHEYDGHFYSNNDPEGKMWPTIKQWVDLVNEASLKAGMEFSVGPLVKKLMVDAGFVEVQEKIVKIPNGPWAKDKKYKEMGTFQREHICDCVDSYTPALFTRILGWTMEDTQALMAKCKKETRDPRNQLYVRFMFTYGRKPSS